MPFFSKKNKSGSSSSHRHFQEKYELQKKLGSGGFSEVHEVVRKSDQTNYAAKIIERKRLKDNLSNLDLEIGILKAIDHPNIVKLVEHIDEKKHIYLIMTLITGGELFDRILDVGYYSEKSAATLVQQILSAVDYLHGRQIVHRDLKPENLLMLDKTPESPVILSDFGLSAYVTDEHQMRQSCGTPGYVAPEILLKRHPYNEKIDCWSTGVIVYILLCGYPPFYGETDHQIYDMIKSAEYEFDSPSWDCISESAKDFINCLLQLNPLKRYSTQQALQHPWLLSVTSQTVAEVDISEQVKEKLKTFLAKTRWKKAFNAQKAIHRMQLLKGGGQEENGNNGDNEDDDDDDSEEESSSSEQQQQQQLQLPQSTQQT
ncbi:calcium/calmodulin-dependent protein kinase type 1-like [Convolutriloba macropyga]|uniref:calcium/calmodulin-dependent protein kinase type 1-like n=1 Tax=Convolutriloba macropyga TaxID=536237 RepID=UPI003F51E9AE